MHKWQYKKINAKLSNTQLNKLNPAIKTQFGETLGMKKRFEVDVPHELLLITRQKTKLHYAFSNELATYIELSKAQISKIIKLRGFLGVSLK